jgi:hypothetical protein
MAGVSLKAAILCALLICGCDASSERKHDEKDGPLPVRPEVKAIEGELNKFPCIDDIQIWKRQYFYAYSKKDKTFDRNIVKFYLESSAGDRVIPGVILLPPGGLPNLDDRDIMIASGTFDKVTGVLKLKQCGRNLP